MDFNGIARDFYEASWILMEFIGICMELYGFQQYSREFPCNFMIQCYFMGFRWNFLDFYWNLLDWDGTLAIWKGIEWNFHELYGFLWNVGAC